MHSLRIIAFCVLAAIAYGILHDMVTAHVAVEYFTVAHPPVFPTETPFLLALGWGVIATWWVGLALGIVLALAARMGGRPKLGLRDVRPLVIRLLAISAVLALVAGAVFFMLHAAGIVWLVGFLAEAIVPDRQGRFMAVAAAHDTSYAVGIIGGLAVAVIVWRRRRNIDPEQA